MFNTEYNGSTNDIGVLDAVAQSRAVVRSSTSGSAASCRRAIAPTCTARTTRTTGRVYTDGIQDGYPFVATGRDNGVMYWGQFDKVKVSGGVFDGESATGTARRPRRRPRPGRLLGPRRRLLPERHLLRRQEPARHRRRGAGAGRRRRRGTSTSCSRRRSESGGAFSIESQYDDYDELGGYDANYAESDGAYILGALSVPASRSASGQVPDPRQVRRRRTSTKGSPLDADYDQKTTEINFNYIIKEFNARVMFFFKNTDFSGRPDRTSSSSASASRSRCRRRLVRSIDLSSQGVAAYET